ncbi:MAG: ammonium transporter [Coriobacteriales bacterium]|jgi:Amt family ammonium transporter|nr:ammonium transporter [Coriobacteriales bacterium]
MFDTGTTAFMLVCVMLVLLMTPGLAFFYGGLARRKNVVNTMFMSMMVLGVVGVVWVLAGHSFAYGGDGSISFFGGFDLLGSAGAVQGMLDSAASTPDTAGMLTSLADGSVKLSSVVIDGEQTQALVTVATGETYATLPIEAGYPELIDLAYQAAFAMITTAIITGSLAGRMKFGAVVAFVTIWVLLVYAPLAHMVWGGDGSLIGDTIGALDFAGGDVVHISSGLTGLILCLILGKRKGFGIVGYRPHNVPFVVLGAALLWFGWFGFNGGSAFAADGVAALAIVNTVAASAAALLSWSAIEKLKTGKSTLVGAATGLVAGLVVITPAAGFVEPWAAVIMGIIVSPICYFAISFLKHKIGYDDALDAFGCHAVGGITGGILTGLFCVPELSWTEFGGLFYTGDISLLVAQVLGILITVVYVTIFGLIIGFVVKLIFKGNLAVDAAAENEGLDTAVHGESAYPAYNGLD